MSHPKLIERFARHACRTMGHDPDALVVRFPPVPYQMKGQGFAFAIDLPKPIFAWEVFRPEGEALAQAFTDLVNDPEEGV